MPLYTYECECGAKFEISVPLAKVGEDIKCPDCGESLTKVMDAPLFVFK